MNFNTREITYFFYKQYNISIPFLELHPQVIINMPSDHHTIPLFLGSFSYFALEELSGVLTKFKEISKQFICASHHHLLRIYLFTHSILSITLAQKLSSSF